MSADRHGDVFIVGCPRSGTTWVHAALTHLPGVACPGETDVFALLARTRLLGSPRVNRVASPADLDAWLGGLWQQVRVRMLAAVPGATRVIEKTPDHVLEMGVIRALVPDARFVLVVRDPREVVASLLHAARTWGPTWAPRTVEEAVRFWLIRVRAGADASSDTDTLTVRYERLRVGENEWKRILEFLGESDAVLPDRSGSPEQISAGRVLQLVGDRFERTALQGGRSGDLNFHGRAPGTQPTLTGYERRYVEWACRRELVDLGYPGARQRLPLVDRWTFEVRRVQRVVRRLRAAVRA